MDRVKKSLDVQVTLSAFLLTYLVNMKIETLRHYLLNWTAYHMH